MAQADGLSEAFCCQFAIVYEPCFEVWSVLEMRIRQDQLYGVQLQVCFSV